MLSFVSPGPRHTRFSRPRTPGSDRHRCCCCSACNIMISIHTVLQRIHFAYFPHQLHAEHLQTRYGTCQGLPSVHLASHYKVFKCCCPPALSRRSATTIELQTGFTWALVHACCHGKCSWGCSSSCWTFMNPQLTLKAAAKRIRSEAGVTNEQCKVLLLLYQRKLTISVLHALRTEYPVQCRVAGSRPSATWHT